MFFQGASLQVAVRDVVFLEHIDLVGLRFGCHNIISKQDKGSIKAKTRENNTLSFSPRVCLLGSSKFISRNLRAAGSRSELALGS